MLSRQIKRACLDSRWALPPPFLLPFTANITTVSHTTSPNPSPDVLTNSSAARHPADKSTSIKSPKAPQPEVDTQTPKLPPPTSHSPGSSTTPLSDSVKELLPLLRAQGPHYITAHIYDRPYLLTQGDTLRLPFLMHGVQPGDVLRLNRATNLGSRDFTLKAGAAAAPALRSSTTATMPVTEDPTTGSLASETRVVPTGQAVGGRVVAPHFIPHIAKGRTAYLDERLFVCRAVVMGVESEPMRIKEKTKRRQRRVKTVKSKHRFTILKIKEVRVRGAEEIESGVEERSNES